MYFSFIRLISNFYDMYIMYSHNIYLLKKIHNLKFKKLNNGYDC